MKPPVDAPTSSARRPLGSIPKASSAFASFTPPRETNGGGSVTATSASSATSSPGLLAGCAAHADVAGDHRGGSARARFEQPALGEQSVEPPLGHRRRVSVTDLTQPRRVGVASIGMSSKHVISHALRAGLLMVAGSALIAGPFLLGLDAAAIVTGVLVGTLAIALGLAGTEPGGRGTLPLSAQAVYDRGLALGLLLSAGIFAAAGQIEAMGLFAAAGIAALRDDLGHALQRAGNLKLPPKNHIRITPPSETAPLSRRGRFYFWGQSTASSASSTVRYSSTRTILPSRTSTA